MFWLRKVLGLGFITERNKFFDAFFFFFFFFFAGKFQSKDYWLCKCQNLNVFSSKLYLFLKIESSYKKRNNACFE